MSIQSLTVMAGHGRKGQADLVSEVTLKMGDVVSIVGATGSGKTTLINDIAMFASRNTQTGRKILINGQEPPDEYHQDPSKNPVAYITQHTNFLSDLPVRRFLETHAKVRAGLSPAKAVEETLAFANQLTGEPIDAEISMTELSGGQTRALLIADAVIIGNSPIILLDEIENAGIHRSRALELLRGYEKIFIFVTHDPRIALLSDFRLVMKNGAICDLLHTDEEEKVAVVEIKKLDDLILSLRAKIRQGDRVRGDDIFDGMRQHGYHAA